MANYTTSAPCQCCNTCPEYPNCDDGDAIYLGEDENGCPIYECCPEQPYCGEGQEPTPIDYDSNGCAIYQCCQSPPTCSEGRVVAVDQDSNGCSIYQCCPEIPTCPTGFFADQSGVDSNQCPTYTCRCHGFEIGFEHISTGIVGDYGNAFLPTSYSSFARRYKTVSGAYNYSKFTKVIDSSDCLLTTTTTETGNATYSVALDTISNPVTYGGIFPDSEFGWNLGYIPNDLLVYYKLQNPYSDSNRQPGAWLPFNSVRNVNHTIKSAYHQPHDMPISWDRNETATLDVLFGDRGPTGNYPSFGGGAVVSSTLTSTTRQFQENTQYSNTSYYTHSEVSNEVTYELDDDVFSRFRNFPVDSQSFQEFVSPYFLVFAAISRPGAVDYACAIKGPKKYRLKFSSSPTGYLKVWFKRRVIVKKYTGADLSVGTTISDTNSTITHEFTTQPTSTIGDCSVINYALEGDFVTQGETELDTSQGGMMREILLQIKKYSFLPGYEPLDDTGNNLFYNSGFPPESYWGANPP